MNYAPYIVVRDMIVTGFQCWCIILLLSNERAVNNMRKFLAWAGFTAIIVTMSYYGMPIWVKVIATVALITIVGRWVYEARFLNLLVYGWVYVLALVCSEMIVIQAWNLLNEPVFEMNIIYDDFVLTIIIMANALLFITVFTVSKLIKKSTGNRKWKEILPNLISGIPFLGVLLCIHISLPEIHKAESSSGFLACSIGIFIAFIYNTMFTQHYLEMLKRKKEEDKALYELKIKNDYYLKRLETEEKIKEVYHDLKNHFLLSKESFLSEELKEKLNAYENFYETGNEILNVLLADKMDRARKKNISLECHADFSKSGFMETLDISTIFGNLLDNAIEAAEQAEEDKKYIFLDIAVRRSMIIAVVKNGINSSAAVNTPLNSTKWNKSYHGYGLINVKKALKKYNGEIKLTIQGKEFMASVIIPMP